MPKLATPEAPESAGFEALAKEALADLPAIEGAMDAHLNPNDVYPDALPDEGTQELHDYSAAVIQQIADRNFDGQAAEIEALKVLGDEGIVAAYEVIPGEAFQAVPDAMDGSGGGGGGGVSNPLDITLTNLTRGGSTQFLVGDEYHVDARVEQKQGGGGIFAAVDIEIFPWCEDVPQQPVTIGLTDKYGFKSATGTFLADQTGNWGATFYSKTPDGALMAGPTLFWTVAADPAGPPVDPDATLPAVRTPLNIGTPFTPPAVPSGITVALVNNSRPEDPNFTAADHWTLTVNGLPLADVEIWGTYQGDPLARVVLGQTDDAGTFTLEGEMGLEYIGAWVERYAVGGVEWEGSLTFAVTE